MNRKDVNIPNLDHRDPSAVQLYRLTTKTLWQRFVCLHCCSQLLQIERLQEAVYKAERYWTWVLEKPKKCKHVFSATIRYLLLTKSLATSAPRPGRRSHSAHMGLAFVLLKTNREGTATPDLQGQPCVANQSLHDTSWYYDGSTLQIFDHLPEFAGVLLFCDSWISTVWHLPF